MDECEALCNRIGIMVGGRLRCLGSPQHIKNKFGTGWQLDVCVETIHGNDLLKKVRELFPGVRLLERHDGALKFQIPFIVQSSLADVFEIIEAKKADLFIKEYSVAHTSLEQIFIHFAQQQDEEKGPVAGLCEMDGLMGTDQVTEIKSPG
jgi:ABC-type uncharacterized transport system ATPase subunit